MDLAKLRSREGFVGEPGGLAQRRIPVEWVAVDAQEIALAGLAVADELVVVEVGPRLVGEAFLGRVAVCAEVIL